jgi:SAM-dependent methyltransferase
MKASKNNPKKSAPRLFHGTHRYYAKYRPGIPNEVINIIIKHFNIGSSDRILDIGCGTGQVVLAMEGRCGEMVCLDSDPEMLKQARRATRNSRMKLVWVNSDSRDLKTVVSDKGTFKIATICRTFHWMDQQQVLSDLDDLIDEDGGIAIFGDGSFWTGPEEWQQAVRKVVQKYLGKERRAGDKTFKQSDERWEDIIARSSFRFVKTLRVSIMRNWNIKSITGWLFSSSFARPDYFGDQLPSFKRDIRNTLLSLNHMGIFQEQAVFSIILASRENR